MWRTHLSCEMCTASTQTDANIKPTWTGDGRHANTMYKRTTTASGHTTRSVMSRRDEKQAKWWETRETLRMRNWTTCIDSVGESDARIERHRIRKREHSRSRRVDENALQHCYNHSDTAPHSSMAWNEPPCSPPGPPYWLTSFSPTPPRDLSCRLVSP